MALEYLAGPYPVIMKRKDADIPGHFYAKPVWLDDLGFCGTVGDVVGGHYSITQYDGVTYRRNDVGGVFGQDMAYDEQNDALIIRGFGNFASFLIDPLIGTNKGQLGGIDSLGVRLRDRMIRSISNAIQTRPLDFSTGYVTETTLDPFIGTNGNLSPAGSGLYYAAFTSGAIYLYDTVNKVQVGYLKHIGRTVKSAHYSKAHNVFLVIEDDGGGDDQITIYANEVIPATVTKPVALTPITKGQVSPVQVMVHGSGYQDYERVEGVLVDWSIISGPGSLAQPPQSRTDAGGFAEIDYIADTVNTGNVVIQADVVVS